MATAIFNPEFMSEVQPEVSPPTRDLRASETSSRVSKSLLEGNGFKVIRKIGSGSYSKVKLAFSENYKKLVAIKIISKHEVPAEFLRNFLYSEIRAVKYLKHENIIQYYQSIESSHRLYVVMQYAENGSILDLIHRERCVSEATARHLFHQIIAGVEYCHSQGVSHRDLKCENILLDEKMVVKLIDFGFARCYKDTTKSSEQETLEAVGSGKTSLTKKKDPMLSETDCGSYAYASPEILKGRPYNPFESDVWSMGVVLFAMVFGRLPFDDRDMKKLVKQVEMPIVFSSRVEVSDSCKECIRRILAPLNQRYNIDALKNDPWVTNVNFNGFKNQ